MLVLSRKVGQRILIGDKIAVTIVRVGQGGVRVGIEAPDGIEIVREELKLDGEASGSEQDSQSSRIGAPR